MTPDKDPQNYNVLAYLAFGRLSVWGGLVTYRTDGETRGRIPDGLRRCSRWWCRVRRDGDHAAELVVAALPLCGFMAGLAGLGIESTGAVRTPGNQLDDWKGK